MLMQAYIVYSRYNLGRRYWQKLSFLRIDATGDPDNYFQTTRMTKNTSFVISNTKVLLRILVHNSLTTICCIMLTKSINKQNKVGSQDRWARAHEYDMSATEISNEIFPQMNSWRAWRTFSENSSITLEGFWTAICICLWWPSDVRWHLNPFCISARTCMSISSSKRIWLDKYVYIYWLGMK